jgi:hypothetical protein
MAAEEPMTADPRTAVDHRFVAPIVAVLHSIAGEAIRYAQTVGTRELLLGAVRFGRRDAEFLVRREHCPRRTTAEDLAALVCRA